MCRASPDQCRKTSRPTTPGHKAETNCYRHVHFLGDNGPCRMLTTRVNFLATGHSGLTILQGRVVRFRGGGAHSARAQVTGMDRILIHSRAPLESPLQGHPAPRWRPHPTRTTPYLSAIFRRSTRETPPVETGGSAICLPASTSVACRSVAILRSPGRVVSQLEAGDDVSVFRLGQAAPLNRALADI